jgi:uroporphyrinogen decarboxylase
MTMTSRERVQTVLEHKIPDRVPIILGPSNTTGIRTVAYRRLRKLLGIQAEERCLYDYPELGTALIDEGTLERLHTDVRGVRDRFPPDVYERNENRDPGSPYLNDWGCEHKEVEPGAYFQVEHPLAEAKSIDDIENYPHWPDMDDPSRVAHVKVWGQRLADENQYAIIGYPWLLSIFERAMAMQGMDKFLMNMSLNPELAQALLEKIAGLCKTLMGHFLDELGDNVDIVGIGDDLGTQESLLISPKMYRSILKPIHADYIAFIKEHTNAKVFFHADGDVFNLVDDFIEIGVDILNPIQTSAGKMSNLAGLKKRYGENIVFCGAIDTQRVLPSGTPEQVREEVRRVIEVMAPGGGYMLAAVHTVTDDVPPDNILAMVDAAVEFGQYPLRS